MFGGYDVAVISTCPGDSPSIVPSTFVTPSFGLNSKLIGMISTIPLCDAFNVKFTFLSQFPLWKKKRIHKDSAMKTET